MYHPRKGKLRETLPAPTSAGRLAAEDTLAAFPRHFLILQEIFLPTNQESEKFNEYRLRGHRGYEYRGRRSIDTYHNR